MLPLKDRLKGLKITEIGIVLVAVPLIFQLIFALVIGNVLHSIESQTRAQTHLREIVATATQIGRNFYSATMVLTMWRFSKDPSLGTKYKQLFELSLKNVDDLSILTQKDPIDQARVQHIKELGLKANQAVAVFALPLESGVSPVIEGARFHRSLKQTLVPMVQEIEVLVADQRKKLSLVDPHVDRLAQAISIGLFINILLCMVLVLFFSKSLGQKIRFLSENMERCARKQPLLPRLSGRDELKEFDDVLHNMNDSLIAVENRKREFVAMINHDLRTPLTALQYVLALALRGKYGHLSDAEIEAVTRQEVELEAMISSINEFLDSEKLKVVEANDRPGDAEVVQ